MFSSLPSASKIYQNSVKPRQKSASSAKKRRKKVHSSSNQHASILDDSVVSLVSCDQESSLSCQRDSFDNRCRHNFERENSSPEISVYSVETSEKNSRSYNTIPEGEIHADIIYQINEKNSRKLSLDLCSKQNEVLLEELNENEQNEFFDSNEKEDSEASEEDFQEEAEAVQSSEIDLPKSDPQNLPCGNDCDQEKYDPNPQDLSCDLDCNEEIKFEPLGDKDISEMTFEEVEASIESESLKKSLELVDQVNKTVDESIVHPGNMLSNASLQSLGSRCNVNQDNPDITNVDSVSTVSNVIHEENATQVEIAVQSSHLDTCDIESSNDTSVNHEVNSDSSTIAHSEPHMDVVLADINDNHLYDNSVENSEENVKRWTNTDSCDSLEQNTEVSMIKENGLPTNGHMEFSMRTESPEQSELSCTESVLCEAKENHQESLHPKKTYFGSTEKTDDFNLPPQSTKEDCYMKSCSNISQSFSNLLSKDSQTVVSSRCSSVPEDLHLSKKFVDKHSQSALPTLLDKSTLTESENSSEEYLSEINSSNEESRNETSDQVSNENSPSRSQNKGSLWNVLPPLAMVKARSRSYVFGSKGPSGSLLGSDELSRFFPDSQLTVFVGTWNMNGHDPPKNIDDFLLPLNINTLPDIYAIGVQESMQSRLEWEVLLQATLGPSHVLFTSASLGVLHLCIFLRRDLIWFCSEPEEATVATRPGTMVKTKGAVAVCFMCFGTSFLFVNSHLTAHEQKLKERLSDYEKIISVLELPKSIPAKNHSRDKDVTSRFECVFWCGDLNFRVMHDRPSVLSFVEEKVRSARPSCSFLVKRDQLHKAMEEGRAFHGFKESVIHFIPSYKFDVGTNTFNSSKLRVPSYTDRILYRSKEKSSISCLHYNAVPDISTSDHKPVYAVFKVTLKPGRDNVPLAAGMFKRDVYLEAIKRRSRFLEVRHNQGQSTICSVM